VSGHGVETAVPPIAVDAGAALAVVAELVVEYVVASGWAAVVEELAVASPSAAVGQKFAGVAAGLAAAAFAPVELAPSG